MRTRDSVYSCRGNSSGTVMYTYEFEPFCVCNIKSLVGDLLSQVAVVVSTQNIKDLSLFSS